MCSLAYSWSMNSRLIGLSNDSPLTEDVVSAMALSFRDNCSRVVGVAVGFAGTGVGSIAFGGVNVGVEVGVGTGVAVGVGWGAALSKGVAVCVGVGT